MTAEHYVTRACLWTLAGLSLCGCAGSVRGAASVAVTLKDCPELTRMVGDVSLDWRGSLGIEEGDAATLKAALNASRQVEAQASDTDAKLKASCARLAGDLGAPLEQDATLTSEQACQQASAAMAEKKASLGGEAHVAEDGPLQCTPGCAAPCDPAAPSGTCAKPTATVTVTGATDEEAAARYRTALGVFVNSLLVLHETAQNTRELVGNAKAAIELGLATGRAVSDGDVASAAASAACLLPPLIRAKQNLAAIRRNYRTLNALAKLAGIGKERLQDADEPPPQAATKDRIAPTLVQELTKARILKLYAFPEGGLAAQTLTGVIALPGGDMLLRTVQESRRRANDYFNIASAGPTYCAVGMGRRVACIRNQPVIVGNMVRGTELILLDNASGSRTLSRVSDKGKLTPNGISFTSSGELLYAYTYSEVQANQQVEFARVGRSGREMQLPFIPEAAALEDLGGGGRANPPITFFEFNGRIQLLYRNGRTLLVSALDQLGYAATVAERTSYDARPIVGGDGVLYVFYYEPKSRTARVASSTDGRHFTNSIVDGRESGWQLEALPTAEGATVVYYYFRGPSDKGLRAASLQNGKLVRSRVILMREERWNAGWHPHLVSDRGRGVLLTYLSNVEDDTRVWAHFDNPSALASGTSITEGDPDSMKDWFVQVGAGAWYTWWALKSSKPEAKELDGALLGEGNYKVDPSILLSANLEARWGPVDVALSYAQNYLDDASKKLGQSTRLLSGSIKIEDLLPGHDIKAEGIWGRYHGEVSRASEGVPVETLRLNTSYVDVHLFALNQWRIKYGLGFSTYRIPAPILAYSVPAKGTHYEYAGSALRDVRFNNIDFAVGYSKLDYASKYENTYFGPMLDATLAGGLSLASFDAIQTPEGDLTNAMGLHLRGNVMLGWLWMHRIASLAQLGFYLRPTYVIEGSVSTNELSRPKDRKVSDADESDKKGAFEVMSLRHGPWFDLGLVW